VVLNNNNNNNNNQDDENDQDDDNNNYADIIYNIVNSKFFNFVTFKIYEF
jgi:hypothetical protein